MNESVWDIYKNTNGSYIVSGMGGIGKTTQLLWIIKQSIMSREYDEKVIPVYVRMKDLNSKKVDPDVLYGFIGRFFDSMEDGDIKRMLRKERGKRFLFLLDGFNELRNFDGGNGMPAIYHVLNDIDTLMDHENVDVIITTRDEKKITEMLDTDSFSFIKLKKLDEKDIRDYLGAGDEDIDSSVLEMLSVPMLLSIYKKIKDENSSSLENVKTKFDLMREWMLLDSVLKKGRLRDIDDYHRRRIIDDILPLFAFKLEYDMMTGVCSSFGRFVDEACGSLDIDPKNMEGMKKYGHRTNEDLMKETLDELEVEEEARGNILDIIKNSGLLDDDYNFSHDLIREFMAAYRIQTCEDADDSIRIQAFVMIAIAHYYINAELNGEQKKTDKRGHYDDTRLFMDVTLFLDFAEFLVGAGDASGGMGKLLETRYGYEKNDGIWYEYEFCRCIGGIYELLMEDRLSYEWGWRAIDKLPEVDSRLDDHDRALAYNYLYYCVNAYRDPDSPRDPCELIENAKDLLDEMPEEERPDSYDILYGKVLSNMGAHCISVYNYDKDSNEYRPDPCKARKWHQESLDYRKRHGDKGNVHNSYRTLMKDANLLGEYEEAYGYYREGMKCLTEKGRLSEVKDEDKSNIPLNIVAEALESEEHLIRNRTYKKEILEELPVQMGFIYKKATVGKRHDKSSLNILFKRAQAIRDILKTDDPDEGRCRERIEDLLESIDRKENI